MEPNSQLDVLLDQSGISRAGLASRVNRLGVKHDVTLRYDHTAVARWLSQFCSGTDCVWRLWIHVSIASSDS